MEWLEGVGEAGGHAGQRQAAGGVRVGRPEQLKCTQPLQMGHLNAYSVLRWGRWHTGQGKERHIDYLRAECRRRLNLLKHLSHLSWGADAKLLIRMDIHCSY